ncbi:MAG TPA: polysaccharide deacetylase family protein [Pirellulaceae bacterium]|nr:polysaccharide deacetylase family protein [Pirellulaceae bacterium]
MNRNSQSRDQWSRFTRRQWIAATGVAVVAAAGAPGASAAAQCASANEADEPALIAITLDLEMSRNFPTRETTHWDFEKGNLNAETKAYAIEAARRVKARGGRLHFFVVGRVLEQENVEWLKQLAADGHPLGNHTYDHVNVKATKPEDIQFRFQRSPWLIEGQKPADVIRENIRLTSVAMKSRLNVAPAGFRTPGGFGPGLADREDVQRMLLDQGFTWCSGKYPGHAINAPKEVESPSEPADEIIASIVAAQANAQPFIYPSGLVEVPMSPISDIGAFRTGRWKLEWFLNAIRAGVTWAIDNRACYDFLGHPSCLYVTDPDFQTIDLICDLVEKAGPKAKLADLNALSQRANRS